METTVIEIIASSCRDFCKNSVVYIPTTLFLSNPVITHSAPFSTSLNVLIFNFFVYKVVSLHLKNKNSEGHCFIHLKLSVKMGR